MHDKYTIQQILQFRYLGMFLINGFWKIISNVKYEICFFACICLYFFVGTNLISSYTGPLAKMCAAISGIALLVVGVLLLLVSVWRIGAPKGYIGIMQNMYRVGLVNSAGEAPVLLDRRKSDKKPRTEIWEFESYGVPFSAWLDYAEKLESALDVAVIQTAPGRDGRKVLLTVIPHPGPWPEILPWNNKYLHKKDSVLVLGENRCEQVTLDLSGIPHILTAGRTGSGKSVLQKSLMLQCLAHGMQVVLVDYKMGVDYSREWPKYCQIITDDDAMLNRLKELQKEMLSRYQLLQIKDTLTLMNTIPLVAPCGAFVCSLMKSPNAWTEPTPPIRNRKRPSMLFQRPFPVFAAWVVPLASMFFFQRSAGLLTCSPVRFEAMSLRFSARLTII